jgi:hypothetical protein
MSLASLAPRSVGWVERLESLPLHISSALGCPRDIASDLPFAKYQINFLCGSAKPVSLAQLLYAKKIA